MISLIYGIRYTVTPLKAQSCMTAHALVVRIRKMTSISLSSPGCASSSSVLSTRMTLNFLAKPFSPVSWIASSLLLVTISVRLAGKFAKYHLCAHSDHSADRKSCVGRIARKGRMAGRQPIIIQTMRKLKQSVTAAASIWLYTSSWMRPTSIRNASYMRPNRMYRAAMVMSRSTSVCTGTSARCCASYISGHASTNGRIIRMTLSALKVCMNTFFSFCMSL